MDRKGLAKSRRKLSGLPNRSTRPNGIAPWGSAAPRMGPGESATINRAIYEAARATNHSRGVMSLSMCVCTGGTGSGRRNLDCFRPDARSFTNSILHELSLYYYVGQ